MSLLLAQIQIRVCHVLAEEERNNPDRDADITAAEIDISLSGRDLNPIQHNSSQLNSTLNRSRNLT